MCYAALEIVQIYCGSFKNILYYLALETNTFFAEL